MSEGTVLVNPSPGSPIRPGPVSPNGTKQSMEAADGGARTNSVILDVTTLMNEDKTCLRKTAASDRLMSLNNSICTKSNTTESSNISRNINTRNIFSHAAVPLLDTRSKPRSSVTCSSSGSSSASSSSSTSFIISPSPSTTTSGLQDPPFPSTSSSSPPPPPRDSVPITSSDTSNRSSNTKQVSRDSKNYTNNNTPHSGATDYITTNHTIAGTINHTSSKLENPQQSFTNTSAASKTNSFSHVHQQSIVAGQSREENSSDCPRHQTPSSSYSSAPQNNRRQDGTNRQNNNNNNRSSSYRDNGKSGYSSVVTKTVVRSRCCLPPSRGGVSGPERGAWATLVLALMAVCGALAAALLLRRHTNQPLIRVVPPTPRRGPPEKTVCQSPACLRAASRLLDSMDRTVDPCDDFYQFTCGQYVAKNIVPDDSHYRSAMQQMQEDVLVIIRKMLDSTEEINETEAMGKAKRLYHSCMNTSFTVHQQDMADSPIFVLLTEGEVGLWPILNDGWTDDMYDLERLLGLLSVYQVHTLFDSYITPDERNSSVYSLQFYKGSPALARSYYLNSTNEEYVKYMQTYRALLSETLIALMPGETKPNETHIDDLIDFETRFANISVGRGCDASGLNLTDEETQLADDETNPRLTVTELEERFPQISWSVLLKQTLSHYPDLDLDTDSLVLTLYCSPFVPELGALLDTTPKRVIVDYLIWRFVMRYLPYVSNYFQQLWQQFRNEVPDPFEERTYASRWKECAALVNEGFGAALARTYAVTYYDETVSHKVDRIVEEVRASFHRVILRQEWLEEDMKGVCSDKLYLMGKKIGYPDYIESDTLLNAEFEGLEILEDHFLNNILRMKRYEVWKELSKLSRPVDKNKDWMIQPLIVNAFHNPTANEIILPLGILREPFYSPDYPMYLNYGSLGVVVGHELVHGFDNHGKRYDAHGNVSQWWSDNMAEQFMERAVCFVDQYSQYLIDVVNKNVDGNETLGDNICDNAGLLNAWLAYERWGRHQQEEEPLLPGMNYTIPQIFLITFGQIWCEVVSREGYEKYSTDMHSPGVYRTNVVAQNSPFFADTWHCPVGAPMNPEKKCYLWA